MRVCPRCRSIYSAQIERCPSDGERVAEEHVYPLVGETLDRYVLVEPIGEGAMGSVYRAKHAVLPREYAIKVLFKDLSTNQTLIERFRREAQAVSTIAHPNIVTVADFVTLENGITFIVMELLSGRTLDRAIAAEAPFSSLRTARISAQIAAGLGEAHRMGFVHRDVKPSNVMLTDVQGREQVKILDFGVVGLGHSPIGTRLTAIGHIIGTPTYMAPEQVHDPTVGPAADLYALGVIMYEMLAGEPPFQGPDRTEVFIKHISEPPPPLPQSEGLELLVAWLLEKRPERRPKNADEVINAIDRLGIVPATEVLVAPVKRSESRLAAIAAAELRSGRPVIARASQDSSPFENDTYEVDTDSAIPREAIRRALGSDDPTPDRLRRSRALGKRVAVERIDSSSDPTFRAPRIVVEQAQAKRAAGTETRARSEAPAPATSVRSGNGEKEAAKNGAHAATAQPKQAADELFPSLIPAAHTGADWSSWNPDGFFEPVIPDPAEMEHRETAPVDVLETGRTDPHQMTVPAKGLRDGAIPEVIAEAGSPENPSSTQIVRERKAGKREDSTERPQGAVEVTDLMLFEPELPPPTVGKSAGPVDDGPTQVDFNALEAFGGVTDTAQKTPSSGESIPLPWEEERQDKRGDPTPKSGTADDAIGPPSPSRTFPFAKTMMTPTVMKPSQLGSSLPDADIDFPIDVENEIERPPGSTAESGLIPNDFSTQVDFIDRAMILGDEAKGEGRDAVDRAKDLTREDTTGIDGRSDSKDSLPPPGLEAPDVPAEPEDAGLAEAHDEFPEAPHSQLEATLLNDVSQYYRETVRDGALQSAEGGIVAREVEGPPLRDPARHTRPPLEPRIVVMIALLIGCAILALIALLID